MMSAGTATAMGHAATHEAALRLAAEKRSALALPILRADQREIIEHAARVKVIATGRRWGKTIMAGATALRAAERGKHVAWVVPTYRNARPVWRFAEAALGKAARYMRVLRSEMAIEFPSGGRVNIFTADNDVALRGEAFDLVIVDEAARVREETIYDVIMPTLADRAGTLMLISTPHGRNWFWRAFVSARGEGAAWNAPTRANPNPMIQQAAEVARERMSERTYRQEWLAEFIEDGGLVFRNARKCATSTTPARRDDACAYVFGVDWGRTNDSTVIAVVDVTTRALVALDSFTGIGYEIQLARLRAQFERWRPQVIIAESNSMGGPLTERLRAEGFPVQAFNTTNASKAEVIEGLALAFEREVIQILPDEGLLSQLDAYEQERLPSGLVRYGAPSGMHDDAVIALALAWWGASVPPPAGEIATIDKATYKSERRGLWARR